ncbi:hypothetical protein ALI22I_34015 [Saccharothrix sp. ALI-22-I]|uniref:hypothetical protein n=1 Tax=Saccharothrix sp. ALI-22-I TaxID=1933778 RepID=UPI00097BFC42|nr:hypothetical protein [Saccharothrix sp. ALI-22-I]ONI83512.1 hypothetical protein ALI22I_34015 [Saccharothrix sp. ALI-22-I]
MPASKIQDAQEVVRWIEEGKTYAWMVQQYKEKYGIDTTITMFSNFRRRRGLEPRIARDPNLVPWKVEDEHGWKTPLTLLRLEGRRRSGLPLRPIDVTRLDNWLEWLAEQGAVVHYDPDTPEGFHYVKREEGDDDIIRRPPDERDGLRPSDDIE